MKGCEKMVDVVETKAPKKSFDDKIHEVMLVRKRDLTAKDIKAMEKRTVVIEKKVSKSTKNEYITCEIYVDSRYKNGIVTPNNSITPVNFDQILAQNGIEATDRIVLNAPVRFLSGINQKDGSEYIRVEVFMSKDVYRSVFIPYDIKSMLDYHGIVLNTVPDFMSQEGTDGLVDGSGVEVSW